MKCEVHKGAKISNVESRFSFQSESRMISPEISFSMSDFQLIAYIWSRISSKARSRMFNHLSGHGRLKLDDLTELMKLERDVLFLITNLSDFGREALEVVENFTNRVNIDELSRSNLRFHGWHSQLCFLNSQFSLTIPPSFTVSERVSLFITPHFVVVVAVPETTTKKKIFTTCIYFCILIQFYKLFSSTSAFGLIKFSK